MNKTITFRQQDLKQFLIDFKNRPDVKDGSFSGLDVFTHKGVRLHVVNGVCDLIGAWVRFQLIKASVDGGQVANKDRKSLRDMLPSVRDWEGRNEFQMFVIPGAFGQSPAEAYLENKFQPFAINEYCGRRRELLDWYIDQLGDAELTIDP